MGSIRFRTRTLEVTPYDDQMSVGDPSLGVLVYGTDGRGGGQRVTPKEGDRVWLVFGLPDPWDIYVRNVQLEVLSPVLPPVLFPIDPPVSLVLFSVSSTGFHVQ